MSKNFYINTSDIASYIGYNPYDPIRPFERFWKKCDILDYNKLINKMNVNLLDSKVQLKQINKNKEELDENLLNKTITKRQYNVSVKDIIKKESDLVSKIENTIIKMDNVSLSVSEQIEKTLGKETITKINDTETDTDTKRSQIKNVIELRTDLSETNKTKLMQQTESFINTTHGILKEDPVISKFEEKFNVKLDVSQTYNKKRFYRTNNGCYIIGGKVDGLYIDKDSSKSYVVEVKNRTKGFFSSLRDYEKLQIQLYMWILDLNEAKLVESYRDKLRITAIYKDQEFIDTSLNYLKIFIDNFESKFLFKFDIKEKYINSLENEKKTFLNKLFLTEIEKAKNTLYEKKLIETECLIDLEDDLD